MTRLRGKVDSNHAEIMSKLRGMGAGCVSTAALGKGAADILAYYLRTYVWIEVKSPGEDLNAQQREFHATWPGPIAVATSADAAMLAVAEAARPRPCPNCGSPSNRGAGE